MSAKHLKDMLRGSGVSKNLLQNVSIVGVSKDSSGGDGGGGGGSSSETVAESSAFRLSILFGLQCSGCSTMAETCWIVSSVCALGVLRFYPNHLIG